MTRYWILLLAAGCAAPDTLHYRLRDPQLVTVSVDGQPALADPTPVEPQHYDMRMRTGDDSLADVSFTLEREPSGIYGKWRANVALSHGEVFELVGPDGWVAALPTTAPSRRVNDQVVLEIVPRLRYWSSRHSGGYATTFAGAHDAQPGEHVISLQTPRSNVVAAEQRGDRTQLWIGVIFLPLPMVWESIGILEVATGRHASDRGLGGAFIAAGLAVDVACIYDIVRGTRRRTLHP